MSYFSYLPLKEQEELVVLYDTLERLYDKALPRKAKKGVHPEFYFGHIWRVMLIPICLFEMELPLESIKVAGGHDLIEEVLDPDSAHDELVSLLGETCTREVEILTIPGKTPLSTEVNESMRQSYYQAVLQSNSLNVYTTFISDHLDCAWDIEGLSKASRKRKVWEFNNLCIPICTSKISTFDQDASVGMIYQFKTQIKKIEALNAS